MTTPDLAGLCERLRATEPVGIRRDQHKPINPDGLEAAAAIERLVADNERMRRALRSAQSFIADGGLAEMTPGSLIYREVTQAIEGASDDR